MYIKDEQITGNGINKNFTLNNSFESGSILIIYNGFIFYKYFESGSDVIFDFAPLVSDTITVSYYTLPQPYSLNAIRYSTPAQIKAVSSVADFIALTDVELEKYIRKAEIAVDMYVAKADKIYNTNNGSNTGGQTLNFPRVKDEVSGENILAYVGIPKDITDATICIAENIYTQEANNNGGVASNDLESEKLGDYSYKRRESKYNNEKEMSYNLILGTKAKLLLDRYQNNSSRIGNLTITNINSNYELMNSREKFRINT